MPMQQNTPDRDRPGSDVPPMSHAAPGSVPSGSPFTSAEWKMLVQTPVQVGRAVMAVSPSGSIGMTKEVMAMRKCLEATQTQGASNPMLQQLGQHLQGNIDSVWSEAGRAFRDLWDATNVRKTAMASCQQLGTLLNKVSPQDALSYKEFVYNLAHNVAEAGKEGGFLGFGGQAISDPERVLLKDLASALGLQRS